VADDGVGLYYEEVGPAEAPLTVVFVHGYCLQMGEFVYQRRALAEQFAGTVRFVFFDHRSHGRSDRSEPGHATIDQLGRDLSTVLDTLAPRGPVVLVGHSMGGMAVMALADQRPELFTRNSRAGTQRVVGVALLSTSTGRLAQVTLGLPAALARVTGPLLPLLLRGARRQSDLIERGRAVGTDVIWVFIRKFGFAGADVDPDTVEYLTHLIASTPIEVVADFYSALLDHDKLEALPVLADIEVLVVCGDRDLVTPLEHSEQIVDALPTAELLVIHDAGHVAHMEQPEVVTDALAKLIASALEATASKRWWQFR